MRPRLGVQGEVLASLGLVMVLSTAVLAALLLGHHERSLRELLGRALVAEAHDPPPSWRCFVPGTQWWSVGPAGQVEPRTPYAGAIDADTRQLADRARAAGEPLLLPGPVWEAIRIAVPLRGGGEVAVAVLPREASFRLRFAAAGVVAFFLVADVAIFMGLGVYVLRRRVVLPLQRLAAAARALTAGDAAARAPREGTAETVALADAMNEMTETLAARSEALEKAVGDLRTTNRELRRARQGLARAERLAAVGRLAAGVAHEVGNPIGAILALADLAARDPGLSDASRRHLERVGGEGARVRNILRQLLDFARPPRATLEPVDLAAAAEQAVALVSAQRRYAGIEFRVERAPDTPTARADPGAVAQILLNLLLNAGDAVQGCEAPRVRVALRGCHASRRQADEPGAPPPPRPPDTVECEVADNGCGVDAEDRERIFDPFFTTKPAGEGTGLGLANAALLAEALAGPLELRDAPAGWRTAFVLRLPAGAAPPAAQARARDVAPQSASGCATPFAPGGDDLPAPREQSSSKPPR
jgi:signal transduction histidine kinase